MYTEQAKITMQNNDTQGALGKLDLTLDELQNIQGNLTLTASESSGGSNINGNSLAQTTMTPLSSPTLQSPQQQEPQQEQRPS